MMFNPHYAFKVGKLTEDEYRHETRVFALTISKVFAGLVFFYLSFLSPIGIVFRATGRGIGYYLFVLIGGGLGGAAAGTMLFGFLYHVLLRHDCERNIKEARALREAGEGNAEEALARTADDGSTEKQKDG